MTLVQDSPAPNRAKATAEAFRTLLVHVEPGPEAAPRLEAAAKLARRLDATLVGLGAEMIESAGVADPFGMLEAQWQVEMRRQVQEHLAQAQAAFRTATPGMRTEWLAIEDLPARAMARLSRAADLIIAGGRPREGLDTYRAADPGDMILLSGRPVLVAPSSGGELRGDAVVVAWKDGREARRALADSLPFLQSAQDVIVHEVCEKDRFEAAEAHTFAIVEYLRRHGISPRAKVTVGDSDAAADEILASAEDIAADLVVAGGYGHSRMGEWVFGGVTRDLLRAGERFVLFSH